MLTLCRTFIRVEYKAESWGELEEFTRAAYEVTDDASVKLPEFRELGASASIEENSLDFILILGAAVPALFAAIASYNNFWDGLASIREHARGAGSFIRRRFSRTSPVEEGLIIRTRITTGQLTSLDRLHRSVQSGELPPEEATIRALRAFERAGEPLSNEEVRNLAESFGADPNIDVREYVEYSRPLPERDQGSGYALGSKARVGRHRRRVEMRREPGETRTRLHRY